TKRTRCPPKKATTGTFDRLDKPSPPLYKARRSWAQVAQLVEHATENRSVGGSTPSLGTISSFSHQMNRGLRPRSGLRSIAASATRATRSDLPSRVKFAPSSSRAVQVMHSHASDTE